MSARAACAQAVIDHLVDALGGEPSCTVRRALVLADIEQYPGTTQTEIMARLDIDKSSLNRDIEWLYDYGCITRTPGGTDGRTTALQTCGYARKNLRLALGYFNFDHQNFKNLLIGLIKVFEKHKPTLRDAKIITVIGRNGAVTRPDILESLYNGPVSTDSRAVNNLINAGLVQKKSEAEEDGQ